MAGNSPLCPTGHWPLGAVAQKAENQEMSKDTRNGTGQNPLEGLFFILLKAQGPGKRIEKLKGENRKNKTVF